MKYRIVETKEGYFWPEYEGHWWKEYGIWKGIYNDMVKGCSDEIITRTREEALRRIEAYDAQVVNGVDKIGYQTVTKIHYVNS
jgi:hypothetical protein